MISILTSAVAAACILGPSSLHLPVQPTRPAAPDTVPGLMGGVGEGDHARLRFFFEVTFMKIDIAWVEAYLDPDAASAVERAVESGT